MKTFLVENYDIEKLVQKLDREANNLIDVIEINHFSVISNADKNPELKKNWANDNSQNKIQSLLQTLYYMRCNLFHGAKEFSNRQVALLTPAYKCLEILNNTILSIYSKKLQS